MNEFTLNEQLTNATLAWRVFDEITYKKIETSFINDYSAQFRDPSSPQQIVRPLMAMARCGGPLASIYKSSKANSNEHKYTIIIQNVPKAFRKVREFDRGLIVCVDFTIDEHLLIVTEDGKYHLIDIFHVNTSNDRTITMSETVSTISSASTFKSIPGTGLVAFRKNQEGFLAVKNVYSPVIQTISFGIDPRATISAWCVLDPSELTLLYAYDNNVATSCADSTRRDQQILPGMTIGIVKLVASDNYKIVAMLRDNGDVLVAPREKIGQNQSFVLKYSNPNDRPKINEIVWCGSEAVIGIRSTSNNWFDLLIINAENPSSSMSDKSQLDITNETLCYTSAVSLFTENDGVRIVSGRNLDFFQRLPTELFSVCSLLSESPGAKLYHAFMNYKFENQTSELLLGQLKSSPPSSGLEHAVKQCIFAASYENDPPLQKLLLNAALFGRSFLSVNLSNSSSSSSRPSITMINELCTNVIRQLHLVNNLQHINISLPITYQQFELIGTEMLIDRLLRRDLHDFATQVTKLLHIPAEKGENRILVQWAVQQINSPSSSNEEAIAKSIKDRLGNVPGIPFFHIAQEAFKAKKYVVVERLLDVKVSLSDQIDMLLQLNKKDEALQKAISCGDTDLVLYVLMRTRSSGSPHEYIIKLSKMKSLPLNLLLQSLEERERMSLHNDMIKHNPEERERIAYSHIVQRFSGALTIADQRTELNGAAKLFREMKNETNAQLVDDEARLIARQDELEKKLLNVQLKGSSLVETLEILLVANEREADQLKKEFNLPDKRYHWVKIQAFAKKQSWTQLMEFGRKVHSPIGYEPFLDVCLRANRPDEARRYVDRTMFSSKLDDERLPFMFAKVQMADEAINAAIKLKSPDALDFIEAKCQLDGPNLQRLRQAREKFQENGRSWLLGGFLKS